MFSNDEAKASLEAFASNRLAGGGRGSAARSPLPQQYSCTTQARTMRMPHLAASLRPDVYPRRIRLSLLHS